jgi:ArsR family transcriptional regulator
MDTRLNAKQIERISKALGDPYRLRIIEAAKNKDGWLQCGSVLNMFNLAQSTVSHHIKQLTDAGLLIVAKDGRNISYQLNKETFTEYIKYLTSLGG